MQAYVGHARTNCAELGALLSTAELAVLRQTLEEDGPKGAWLLVESWRPEALQLIEAAPSQRAGRLRRGGEGQRLLTLYVAVVLCHMATKLLDAVARNAVEPGGPYRLVTRFAAQAAYETSNFEESLWPFLAPGPSWYVDPDQDDEDEET